MVVFNSRSNTHKFEPFACSSLAYSGKTLYESGQILARIQRRTQA